MPPEPLLEVPHGPLAQLAEQGTLNPKVGGSIPPRPTGEAPRLAGLLGFWVSGGGGRVPNMSRDGRGLLVMEASGHVFRVERKRGPVWYAKYRLADGRQIQRKIGPAWTERGRPPAGWFTRRGAEEWLRSVLDQV